MESQMWISAFNSFFHASFPYQNRNEEERAFTAVNFFSNI